MLHARSSSSSSSSAATKEVPSFGQRKYVTLPLSEVLKLPQYKANRDTARHMARLLKNPEFDKNHSTLPEGFAIITVKGRRTLGNGNTRVGLHKAGEIVLPPEIQLVEYFPPTDAEAEKIYNGYDNPLTAKDQQDRGITALKQNGFKPAEMHKLFQTGKFVSGLTFADASIDGAQTATVFSRDNATEIVARWKSEIAALNDILLEEQVPVSNKTACSAGIIAGALVTLQPGNPKADEAVEFWPRFFRSSGKEGNAKAAENYLWNGAALCIAKQTKKHRERSFMIRDEAVYAVNHCDELISKRFPKAKRAAKRDD